MHTLLAAAQDSQSSLDVITVALAGYGALLSSLLALNTFQRDRHRLRIRVQWITRHAPGVTVKCVNTGHRPIGVEQVLFATEEALASKSSPLSSASHLGWHGAPHPEPPTPSRALPVLLEESDSAELHFALDERFADAAGVMVFDGFGRLHKYRFTDVDRMGLALSLSAHGSVSTMNGDEIRALAADVADDEGRAAIERLAAHADRVGRLQIRLVPTTRPDQVQLSWAPSGTPGRSLSFDEDETYVRVQRAPFPVVPFTTTALAAVTFIGLAVWAKATEGGMTIPFVVLIVLLPVVTILLAAVSARRRALRAYRRAAERRSTGAAPDSE